MKRVPAVQNRLNGQMAAEEWIKASDKEGKSWVAGFSRGTVSVITENPSFGQELSFTKKEAIRAMNDAAGKTLITDIKVRVGSRAQEKDQ